MLKDPVTTVCALVGAGLGIFNFVQGFQQRRVRLRVVPKVVSQRRGGLVYSTKELISNAVPCIEVVNLSNFPVTISEVGFTLNRSEERAILIPLDSKLPCRLNSRESVTVHASPQAKLPRNIVKAYATTDCAETRVGDSPVLRLLRKDIR